MNRCEAEGITAERGALAPWPKNRGLTPPAQVVQNKGSPGEIRAGAPYRQKSAAAPDGQPVGCVSAATSGYHYTLDHLLSLETPCCGWQPSQPPTGSSPSC